MSIVSNDMNLIYRSSYPAGGRVGLSSDKTADVRSTGFGGAIEATRKDSLSIGGSGSMSDEEFVSRLSSDISAEVKAGKSDSYLDSIKQQIALGEYDINADDIAGKILGF